MVPWATGVTKTHKFGQAAFFNVEFCDLLAFVFPLYGRGLPNACPDVGQIAWLAAAVLWIWLVRCYAVGDRRKKLAEPPCHTQGIEGMFVRWLQETAPYASLNLSVSLYLLLTTSCVFLSGFYTVSNVRFSNSASLFGALQRGPETLNCLGLRWFCALTAMGTSLLLARAQTLPYGRVKLYQGMALLCTCGCFSVYFFVRWRAVKVVHDPHKSILAVDWSLFGVLVALSMRSAGVSERICSCWLRKFVTISLACMYLNAGISKLEATGLVWFSGEILRQLIRDFRYTSAWPWLSDVITRDPGMGLLLGISTFIWELPLSIVVLVWELPLSFLVATRFPWSCWRRGFMFFRWLWALICVAMHFGIFLLVFPPFTTFVHALVALVLDPFTHLGVETSAAPATGVERSVDPETQCQSSAQGQCRMDRSSVLRGRTSVTPQSPIRKDQPDSGRDVSDRDEQKEQLSRISRTGLWASSVLLLLCVSCWIYVGFNYTNKDHHPFLPFSSFSMYSTYKSRALKYPGWWDQARR